MNSILESIGWNGHFESAARAARREGSLRGVLAARIAGRDKAGWTALCRRDATVPSGDDSGGEAPGGAGCDGAGPGEAGAGLVERRAIGSGSFLRPRTGPELPEVGDWVLAEPLPGGELSIRALLPRSSRLSRKTKGETMRDRVAEQVLVANIDLVVIAVAAGKDWNDRRIERYLALAHDSGAQSLVAVTKADLCREPEVLADRTRSVAPGTDVIALSARRGWGMDALRARLAPGRTAVLIGSSGSGKTTILNALAGRALGRVQAVRAADERGRHTTSARSLFLLPSGALLVDTPGLREVQLWTEEEDVDAAFPEIKTLAGLCRFRDCGHGSEPGCAVRGALEEGRIVPERLEAWRKLRLELELLARRRGPRSPKMLGYLAVEEGRRLKAASRGMDA